MEGLEEEKRRKRKAMIATGVIQAVLLLILYFLVAWREPNPPNPEFGIEVNFGTSETGSGDEPVQSPTPTPEEQPDEPSAASEESNTEETQQAETKVTPVQTVKNPNADVVQEKKEETKPKSSTTNTAQKETATTKQNTQQQGTYNSSQGKTGDKGDQGNPEGDINKDALYNGKPGGGNGGPSLDLAGWEWDKEPVVIDTSDEIGTIIFDITLDEFGDIRSAEPRPTNISTLVVRKYRDAVFKLIFIENSSNPPAKISKGTITFKIVSSKK